MIGGFELVASVDCAFNVINCMVDLGEAWGEARAIVVVYSYLICDASPLLRSRVFVFRQLG